VHCQLTTELLGPAAAEYDAFVLASPAGHAAQTRAWAELARAGAHVKTCFAVVRDEGGVVGSALVLRPVALGLGMPWAWVERGPVVADVASLPQVTRALGRALRRRGVARFRVMPYWANDDAARAEELLRSAGLADVQTADGPHACTLRFGLGGATDADLFAGKSKEQVRWRARQAERAGATARRGEDRDWGRLREMYRGLMQAQGKRDRPDAWWDAVRRFVSDDARGAFFACDHDGTTVAAAVVLRHGGLATYAWGASVPDKLPFSKAIPALVAAIRWARDVGCHTFDLGGVPMEGDHDAKRAAIATFKYDFDRTRVRLVREHAGWC
jgi:lipid II:glycine glycyltransferase (peptidoglycan interpeptide bridge formation enzyme)